MIFLKPSREFLKKRANKNKSITDWDYFIQKRNQVTRLKNKLKQEYFDNLLSEDANWLKQLWKTTSVKRLVTKDDKEDTCRKDIANHFITYFFAKITKIYPKIFLPK